MSTPLETPLASPELTEETLPDVEASPEAGDHERFAHYVRKEKIVESAVTGAPVVALCGKVWVPNRDPSRFPVCPDCQAVYDGLRPEGGSSDDSSGE